MKKWIIVIVILILAGLAVGFYLTKDTTDTSLYSPTNLSGEPSDSQTVSSDKNQTDGSSADSATQVPSPATQKKVEQQKPASSAPRPPELP